MEKLEKKNLRKGIALVCLMAAIAGACYCVASSRTTTRGGQDEVREVIKTSEESQAEPKTQTTTDTKTNEVEATQPVESYNDSIAPTYENDGATEATTTTGSTNNKVVAEDNTAAIAEADEEIHQAESNGATVVEDEVTGITASSETQPAVEEEKESTQKRVELNFSEAVDATNEK